MSIYGNSFNLGEKKMKSLFLIGVIGMLFLSGCQTGPTVEGGAVLSQGGSRQVNLTGGKEAVPETVEVLENAKDLLKVTVEGKGVGDAAELSSNISAAAKGGIAVDVARVVEGSCDVKVLLNTELEKVDVDGEYRRLNAIVKVALVSFDGNRTYGTSTFRFKGVRKQGTAAVSQFEVPASQAVVNWLKDNMRRLVQEEVEVAVITFKLPRPRVSLTPVSERDAANIKAIGQKLVGMKGVLNADCIMQNYSSAICRYRLLYKRGTYPHGIANEAALQVRSIAQ